MPSSWSTCPPPRRPSGTVASHATEGVGAGHPPGGGLSSSPVRGRTLSGDTGGGFPSLPPRHVQIVRVDVDVAEIIRPAGAGNGAHVVRVDVVVDGLGKRVLLLALRVGLARRAVGHVLADRKSTRLNSSH